MSDNNDCGCAAPTQVTVTVTACEPTPQVLESVTVCNDGALSGSDGQGTCSWHGGVAE